MKKTYIRPEITIIALDKTELMTNLVTSTDNVTDSGESTSTYGAFSKGNTWFDEEDEEDW